MKGRQPISTNLSFNATSNDAGKSALREVITATEERTLIYSTGIHSGYHF